MDPKFDLFHQILYKNLGVELVPMNYWDGKLDKPIDKLHSLTFITTVMNRKNDFIQTFQKNIEDNKDYKGDQEWLILDYGSMDDFNGWVAENLWNEIASGLVTYYRTEEPKHYQMAHSRNIGFRLARGEIVNSVDADNFTNKDFAKTINALAHQEPKMAFFAKGRRMLRGRLGFYKKEFVDLLGGYDEDMTGYGHEDHDLMYRAFGVGMKMMWYGGTYWGTTGSKKHQTANYLDKDWKYTEHFNKVMCVFNLWQKRFKANQKRPWGCATVTKNFSEIIHLT